MVTMTTQTPAPLSERLRDDSAFALHKARPELLAQATSIEARLAYWESQAEHLAHKLANAQTTNNLLNEEVMALHHDLHIKEAEVGQLNEIITELQAQLRAASDAGSAS